MAFPPNYQQERSNRERSKQRKLQEKLARREEKSAAHKDDHQTAAPAQPDSKTAKDS